MGRKKVFIDPECGKRLKYIIARSELTQKKVASLVDLEPQQITNIVQGRRRLTPDTAKLIVERVFPDILPEWLLCETDYMTADKRDEERSRAIEKKIRQDKIFREAFSLFLNSVKGKSGYSILRESGDGNYEVSDRDGHAIGWIDSATFEALKREIENYTSYLIQNRIKDSMRDLPAEWRSEDG